MSMRISRSKAAAASGRKSIAKNDANKTKPVDDKSDEVFERNIEIVISLLPNIAFKYSDSVRKWIRKFFDPSVKKSIRNSYLAYLVFQMQNMKISDPFDKAPPKVLEEPNKIMNAAKWKTIQQETDKELQQRFVDIIPPQALINFRSEFKRPADFLDDHPVPLNGIISYGGCFSNHF